MLRFSGVVVFLAQQQSKHTCRCLTNKKRELEHRESEDDSKHLRWRGTYIWGGSFLLHDIWKTIVEKVGHVPRPQAQHGFARVQHKQRPLIHMLEPGQQERSFHHAQHAHTLSVNQSHKGGGQGVSFVSGFPGVSLASSPEAVWAVSTTAEARITLCLVIITVRLYR